MKTLQRTQVESVNHIFNRKLHGMTLNEISGSMEEYIISEMQNEIRIIKPIIEQINKSNNRSKNSIFRRYK